MWLHSKFLPASFSKSAPNILIDWGSGWRKSHRSKISPSCLVFGDIHKYFVGSAKTDLQPFLSGVLQGGSYVTPP